MIFNNNSGYGPWLTVSYINVEIGFDALIAGAEAKISDRPNYVEADEGFDADSSLQLFGPGALTSEDETSKTTLTFSSTSSEFADQVQDVAFRINDIDISTSANDDHVDILKITAFDVYGNEVDVVITPELGGQIVDGNTVTGDIEHSAGVTPANQAGSVLVTAQGPLSRIEIEYLNDGSTDQIVTVTDVTFGTISAITPEAGDDVLNGGAGDDIILGKAGDDTITGGTGADTIDGGDDADTIIGGTAGDTIDGGTGGDDNDTLDLTGVGPFRIVNETVDPDGDSTSGTIQLLDYDGNITGEFTFTEIETILGAPVNDGPVATDDSGSGDEDTVTALDNVLGNDSDTETAQDDLVVTDVNGSAPGTPVAGDNGGLITINEDGTASFDPNGDFEALGEGEEATTEVTYTISDGDGGTDTATVTVTVTGVNDAPDAINSSYTVDQDEAFGDDDANAITDDTGEGADSDPEDDTLTVLDVAGVEANVGQPVAGDNGGEFVINADGSVDFDANGEFDDLGEGEEASTSVTYTITDGNGGTDTATVTFTVTGTNDAPVEVQDEDATDQDTVITLDNVLGNDSDPDNDDLTVTSVNGEPTNVGTPVAGDNGGLITINPDGSYDFDANGEFNELGAGEFEVTEVTYSISDGNGGTDTTTVTITVVGTNDGPVAVDDTGSTDAGTPTVIDVLANDSDPDDDVLSIVPGSPVAENGIVEIVDGKLVLHLTMVLLVKIRSPTR